MKNLAELQGECVQLGLEVRANRRPSKDLYITALQDYHWRKNHPGRPLPEQIQPMLLASWDDLSVEEASEIESDHHAWAVQQKLDGVRILVHIGSGDFCVTSRTTSVVTYRLSEHQDNLKHLASGWESLEGTVLDGELVCPKDVVDCGSSITGSALQAAVAILSTTPEKAARIQAAQAAHLELHVFDILRFRNADVCALPLFERLAMLERILGSARNPFVKPVPTAIVAKRSFHERVLASEGEGTVWKKLNGIYQPGHRVRHWLKRKRSLMLEGIVTDAKPRCGGHARVIGAVQFSAQEADGSFRPIGWVSGWSDAERRAMTRLGPEGQVTLNPAYLGRRALIQGQDKSAKSRRIRHARMLWWLEPLT